MKQQRFVVEDGELLSEIALRMGWDLQFDQLERGSFSTLVDHASTADAQFFHKRYHRAICVHGAVPAGMVTFLLPACQPAAAAFCGNPINPGTLCAFVSGDHGALRTAGSYDYVTCCFNVERLDRAMRTLGQRTLASLLPHTTDLSPPAESIARLQRAAQAVFLPPTGAEEMPMPAVADQEAEERVLAALCAALVDANPRRPGPLGARNRWRCVRAVREYAESNLGQTLGLETLCRIAGVSERTLSTAFREVLGVSPQQFIKTRRLAAARRALVGARQTGMPIKAVAFDLGFWHLGYFARDYRALFGESPSETLTRR